MPGDSRPEISSVGLCVSIQMSKCVFLIVQKLPKTIEKLRPAPGGLGNPLGCPRWPPPPFRPCLLLEIASAHRSERSRSPSKRDAQLARAVLSVEVIGIWASGRPPPFGSYRGASCGAGQSRL